jgi:hypothetical protein
MNERSEEFVQLLMDLLLSESKISFEEPIAYEIIRKIISSSYYREICVFSDEKISGQEISSFLSSRHIAEKIEYFGIRIQALTILGKLDLDSIKIEFPLIFKECEFKDEIILRDAKTKYLSFEGSKCTHINASRLIVDGQLWLNQGFIAIEGIELNNAQINGNMDLSSATIYPTTTKNQIIYCGKSLVLDCATIGGNLWLWSKNQTKRFESFGEISLIGAVINGNFICREAKLECCDYDYLDKYNKPLALIANSAIVKGTIEFSNGFESVGQILLMNMEVHGDLKFRGGKFKHSPLLKGNLPTDSQRHAISFDRSIISGSIFLTDNFEAIGQVRLIGTTIKSDLDCSGGKFILSDYAEDIGTDNGSYSICIIRSYIQGDVSFCKTQLGRIENKNFSTDGVIYLNSVKIGNNLDLTRGVEFNKNKLKENGLHAHKCAISGWVKFRNITLNDETIITLSGSTAGGLDHNWNVFFNKESSIKKLAIDRFIYDRYACHDDDNVEALVHK